MKNPYFFETGLIIGLDPLSERALLTMERMKDTGIEINKSVCKNDSAQLYASSAFTAVLWLILLLVCETSKGIVANILYAGLLIAEIAYTACNVRFEQGTLGPDQAIDQFYYTQSTYEDVRESHKWNIKALTEMNSALNSQHVSMRQHLQERHLQMETNIGEDINDA